MENEKSVACGCVCHKSVGILVALIGLDVLLGTLGVLSERIAGIVWPILLILIGIRKALPKGVCKCCSQG